MTLALRYFGPGKRARKINQAQACEDLAQIGQMFGKQARKLPAYLKDMVRGAEELKRCRKGLRS